MHKIIYKVEFDQWNGTEGIFCDEYILNKEYDIGNGIYRLVVNIEEFWAKNRRTIIVHFEGGREREIFNISTIYRRLKSEGVEEVEEGM